MVSTKPCLLLLVGLCLVSPRGQAADQTHDGLFLRLSAGGAYGYASNDFMGDSFTIRGGGLAVNMAIGYSIVENLSLEVDFTFSPVLYNPSLEANGIPLDHDYVISWGGFGGGATFFIMPINLYLSASLGLGHMSLSAEGETVGETEEGFYLKVMCGKEWWVSANWGLGPALIYSFGIFPDAGHNWYAHSISGVLSATYN